MALSDRNAEGRAGDMPRDPRLDRAYREAGDVAPPAHLDAAILAAAHREVGARPRSLSAGLRRWRVPISIAAVVVLSATLVTLVQEEGGEALVQIPPSAPLPKLKHDAAPLPPPLKPAQSDAARPAAQPPAPAPHRAASRDVAPALTELGQMAEREGAGAVPPASSGAGTAALPEAASRPAPQPFLAASRDAGERRAAAPTAPALEDSAAPPPPPAAVRRSAQPMARGAASEPEHAKVMAQTADTASARPDRLPVWRDLESEPPQKWLERIEELKRQGRAADAADMLAEFKRRFPGHSLPPGLR